LKNEKGRSLNDFEEPSQLFGIVKRQRNALTNDDMIEHFDFQQLPGSQGSSSQRQILHG
jgi:hypothetical protein